MDLYDPNRSRHRKPISTERFLGVSTHAPLFENPSSSARTNGGDELSEDVVVFMSEHCTEPNHSSTPSSSSASSTPRNHFQPNHRGLGPLDTFGILAALPENEPSPNARNTSHLFHKASVSSTSSSSSRSIPAIPKPPHERIPSYTSSSSGKYPQSAPVNVPVMSPAMMMARSRRREFDDDDGDEGDEGEEMLPPHQIVARNSAQSPMLASSVLEGAGRTLKGRDLRQVRNAVWRQTGFLD
ncbi:protein S40-7-like [Prosopis cineraria]|uniref:protein S40-7-like n=1 Tax=Prosopis cineraria TaxID=364024 RepID=UPI00240FC12E|nr:protein S40-7-like [Prosopis cineraria]